MPNIILHHWHGPMKEIVELSMKSIKDYADHIGVEYRRIDGEPFKPGWHPATQKMIMLDEQWDNYDKVAMFDADMFWANKTDDNVFDLDGMGLHDHQTDDVIVRFYKILGPQWMDPDFPYWGGCLWNLPKDIRKLFRKHIDMGKMVRFNKITNDEGMMHWLAIQAGFREKRYLGTEWSQGSYFPNPEKAKMIHVRKKTEITGKGPRNEKIVNYKPLHQKGII